MRNNHDVFAAMGEPWVTPADWHRECALADNPHAATKVRESALDFTQRASLVPTKARPRPAFRDDPFDAGTRSTAELRERLEIRKLVKAVRGGSRTVKSPKSGNFQIFIDPPSHTELGKFR